MERKTYTAGIQSEAFVDITS